MKRTRLNALQMHVARAALLMTVMLVPLSWPVVVNADLFGELKKAVEKVVEKELDKAAEETQVQQQPSAEERNQYAGQVQYFLHLLGYEVGTITGYLTPETVTAIRAFQADHGLPVDGLVTDGLVEAIAISFERTLVTGERPGMSGTGSALPTPQAAPAPASQVPSTASSLTTTTPAPTHDQAVADTNNTVAGLNVPNQWSTIENGIVVPHPVKKDGRLLTIRAIVHYSANKMLPASKEAIYAMGEYLLLADLRKNPGAIDRDTIRYAMFLTDNERSRYLCWEKSPNCNADLRNEVTWAGSNEFETRRNRQAFIDDYRDRLVAVGAKQPINFLDVGLVQFSLYDQAKRGFALTSRSFGLPMPSFYGKKGAPNHLLSPHHSRNPKLRDHYRAGGKGRNPRMTFSYDPVPEKPSNFKGQGYLSEFKPMSESEATSLVNRLWPLPECAYQPPTKSVTRTSSVPHDPVAARKALKQAERERNIRCPSGDPRTAHVVLHQTLTEFRQTGHDRFAGKFVVTAAVAYEDPLFKRELHHFSLGGSAAEPAAVASPAVGPAVDAVKALPASRITDGVQPVSLPMIKGDLAVTIDSTVLSRQELKNRPDYQKYLAFAYLGKHPDILDHSPVAQGVAMGYLTNDAKLQYLNLYGTPPAHGYSWKGADEFHHERMSQTFVADYRSSLLEAAPKLPFDMWIVEELPLRPYDFNRFGYELLTPLVAQRARVGDKGEYYKRTIPGLGRVLFDTSNFNPTVSDFMPMDAGRAEELSNKLVVRNNQRQVYYGARLRIKDVVLHVELQGYINRLQDKKDKLPRYDAWQFKAVAEIKSLGIYADSELTQLVHEFDLSK